MQKGDAGDAVQRLQEALIEEGYLAREADGVFGSTTEKALRLYQRDQGLPVTGQADETMLTRLAETDAPRKDTRSARPTACTESNLPKRCKHFSGSTACR